MLVLLQAGWFIKKFITIAFATIASLLLVLVASPVFATVGDIVVSEYMADPVVLSDTQGEWIELENKTASDVDISGWMLDDGGAATFTFPASTAISADGFFVVCRSASADANCDIVWSGMSLSNTGDTITLKDDTSEVVDTISYTEADVTPGASTEVETQGDGEKVLAANTTDTAPSGDTGTPGADNALTLPDVDAPVMANINMFVNGVDTDLAKVGDEVRIVADVSDENGVDKVQIWVRNFPYTGQQVTSGEMTLVSGDTYEFVFTLPADYQSGNPVQETFEGNYYNFRPYDTLGNSAIGNRKNFTVDNTAPTINWQKQPLATYGGGDGFHVRPITTEIGTVRSVYIDAIDPANLCFTKTSDHKNMDTKSDYCQALWDGLSDGEHKFITVFEDFAGNATTSESATFVIDRTGPEVSGVVLNGQNVAASDMRANNCDAVVRFYVVGSDIDVQATINDGLSDTESVRFKVRKVNANGCSVSSVYSSGFITMTDEDSDDVWVMSDTFDTSTLPSSGTYTLMLQTTDAAGNTTTNYIDVEVDKDPPVVTFEPVVTTETSPVISGTVTDPENTPTTVTVTVNGVTYNPPIIEGVWTITVSPALAVGTYDVTVVAADSAGNSSEPLTVVNGLIVEEIETDPVDDDGNTDNTDNDDTNNENTDTQQQPTTPQAAGAGIVTGAVANANATGVADAGTDGEVDGAGNNEADQQNGSQVLQSTTDGDTAEGSQEGTTDEIDGCFTIFGICWYWYIIPVVGAILYRMYRRYMNRKSDK